LNSPARWRRFAVRLPMVLTSTHEKPLSEQLKGRQCDTN
jgi:hypothetical protein